MKTLKIFATLILMLTPIAIYADGPNDPDPGIGSNGSGLNPNGGSKSVTQEWITVYTGNGQMWFDFSDEIDGFNVAAYDNAGHTVMEYVTDDTPFAVPFTSGSTVYIICVTNSGNTFTGQISF